MPSEVLPHTKFINKCITNGTHKSASLSITDAHSVRFSIFQWEIYFFFLKETDDFLKDLLSLLLLYAIVLTEFNHG